MCRSSECERRDRGFSLIEVVVAIALILVVLVAVLPAMVNGIRARSVANTTTQGKALVASELERMRNLPFQVQPNAGQFVDLFDRYYQDVTPPTALPACRAGSRWLPPPSSATGYVSATTARCDYEPRTGAFYRVVRRATGLPSKGIRPDPDLDGAVVVVTTQFLDASTPPRPLTPPPSFDTKIVGKDTPPSSQVGVMVTVMPDQAVRQTPVSSYTQIARTYQTSTRLRATSDSTALEASTTIASAGDEEGNPVSMSAGLVHLDTSLVAASRVDVAAAAVTASAATGENAGGTRATATSPPDDSLTWSTSTAGQLTSDGCALVCWGPSAPSGSWQPSTIDGLPSMGTPTNPLEVALRGPDPGVGQALQFGPGPTPLFRPDLGLTGSLVSMRPSDFGFGIAPDCHVTDAGAGLGASGGGWATSTTTRVESCSTARTAEVAVLARGREPLITVSLRQASARCLVDRGAAATAVDFEVEVAYWNGSAFVEVGSYRASGSSQLPDPATLDVGGTPLSRWIDSWSVARRGDGISETSASRAARVDVPAIVSILTVPLRFQAHADGSPRVDAFDNPVTDERSTLSVTVGSLSCTAEDRR